MLVDLTTAESSQHVPRDKQRKFKYNGFDYLRDSLSTLEGGRMLNTDSLNFCLDHVLVELENLEFVDSARITVLHGDVVTKLMNSGSF